MARLHEYQGKAILAANGFKIPSGRAATGRKSQDPNPPLPRTGSAVASPKESDQR